MRVLHSSDWHIGRTLYGRKRYDEFEAFLNWLAETIRQKEIDVLLVAGDVFDTSTPSNRSQELYYRFLCRVAASSCRHIIITAGNHDSPSFLDAPKELLLALDVHVVGAITEDISDEVIVLGDTAGEEELIVCAVPYLRDKDIRCSEAGEGIDDKEKKIIDGIRNHYASVCSLALEIKKKADRIVPVIVMGHMFTAGGKTDDGDGVRDLYIGSLGHIGSDIFPAWVDYVALGHLHVPQKVNGLDKVRYSGSPIPVGFGEAKENKSLCIVDFYSETPEVELLSIPVFQKLVRIKGDWNHIRTRLLELAASGSDSWIEVFYDGEEIIGDLRDRIDSLVSGTALEILRIRNDRIVSQVLSLADENESLNDLSEKEIFERCLEAHDVSMEERYELRLAYTEIISSMNEADSRAE